jgi:hypothetical protein
MKIAPPYRVIDPVCIRFSRQFYTTPVKAITYRVGRMVKVGIGNDCMKSDLSNSNMRLHADTCFFSDAEIFYDLRPEMDRRTKPVFNPVIFPGIEAVVIPIVVNASRQDNAAVLSVLSRRKAG